VWYIFVIYGSVFVVKKWYFEKEFGQTTATVICHLILLLLHEYFKIQRDSFVTMMIHYILLYFLDFQCSICDGKYEL